jgi:hypothetical protein
MILRSIIITYFFALNSFKHIITKKPKELTFFIKLNPQYNNIIKHKFINQNNIILDISDKI